MEEVGGRVRMVRAVLTCSHSWGLSRSNCSKQISKQADCTGPHGASTLNALAQSQRMPARAQSERTPLLPQASTVGNDDTVDEPQRRNRLDGLLSRRAGKGDSSVAAIVVFSCAIFALVWLLTFQNNAWDNGRRVTPPRKLPKDPLLRATALLEAHPLIDGVRAKL